MNTMLIIAEHGFDSNNYAAGFCANLVITNASVDYGDWYLPSKYELDLMYLNIGPGNISLPNVAVFADANYWSSSESEASRAHLQQLGVGTPGTGDKDGTSSVRAVRAF
jgi:hypothetical protein